MPELAPCLKLVVFVGCCGLALTRGLLSIPGTATKFRIVAIFLAGITLSIISRACYAWIMGPSSTTVEASAFLIIFHFSLGLSWQARKHSIINIISGGFYFNSLLFLGPSLPLVGFEASWWCLSTLSTEDVVKSKTGLFET